MRFSAYGDAQASYPLFTLRAKGSYSIGVASAVPGAHEADFARPEGAATTGDYRFGVPLWQVPAT